ncbi:MAG: SbmA/BacA-like family transporter [Rhodospirillales bacterium]
MYWGTRDVAEIDFRGLTLRVPERWIARGLLCVVLFLNIIIVWLLKLVNDWNGRFFNALQDKNLEAFWAELRCFVVLAAMFIVIAVYRLWLRQMLQIAWRRWLTQIYYNEWLRNRTYYRMELASHGADNPEQRIQEDCEQLHRPDPRHRARPDLRCSPSSPSPFYCGTSRAALPCRSSAGSRSPGYMMWWRSSTRRRARGSPRSVGRWSG